jgi:sugar phosphate isomerase/epimerase
MKLGISSYTYTWSVGVPGYEPENQWNELDLLQQAKDLDVECLQIADNLPLHQMDNERLMRLRASADKLDIGLEAGARGMTPDMLEKYTTIADLLGSPILRFVIDSVDFKPSVTEIIQNVRRAVPELERRDILLAIENHDRLKAREFLEIIQGAGSPSVGICLDSVNSMGAGEGIETVTTLLSPYTFNLHIKEFIVQRHSHMMGFSIEGRPVGQGQLPLEWMLAQLGPQCRSAILESWTPPEADLSETLEKELKWAMESIAYLKKHCFK